MVISLSLKKSVRRLVPLALLLLLTLFSLRSGQHLSVSAQNSGAIREGDTSKPLVSLMVNVDWGDEFLPGMLEVFEDKNVRTTFFVVGRWARKSPELLRQIAAAGHEIATHGDQHKMATRLSAQDLDALILDGAGTLEQILGHEPPPLFAPPSGDCDEHTVARARSLGFQTVLWTLDTVDWKRPPADQIIGRIIPKASNGALILMHPTEPTLRALPSLIDLLREKGLEPTTVTEVLGALLSVKT